MQSDDPYAPAAFLGNLALVLLVVCILFPLFIALSVAVKG